MKINVLNIVNMDGASLDVEFNEVLPELNSMEAGLTLSKPVEFQGKLVNSNSILKLSGHLKFEYGVACCKCLKEVTRHMEIDIAEDFMDAEITTDPEVYTYKDNQILLDKVLQDHIILNLPVRQVCDDTCKGLCLKCGTDLNVSTCGCGEETTNMQMEVLKNFFNN